MEMVGMRGDSEFLTASLNFEVSSLRNALPI
jgi:hypothetical protein